MEDYQNEHQEPFSNQGSEEAAAENFSSSLASGETSDSADPYLELEEVEQPEQQEQEPEAEEQPEPQWKQGEDPSYAAKLEEIAAILGYEPGDLDNPRTMALVEAALEQYEAQQQNYPAVIEKRYEERYTELEKMVRDPEIMDERVVKDFGDALARCETPQDQMRVLAAGGINLVQTLLPRLLPDLIEQAIESRYEGMGAQFRSAQASNIWDEVRSSDIAFSQLPEYGTKAFMDAGKRIYDSMPWISQLQFTDEQGRPLSRQASMRQEALVVAQLLTGHHSESTERLLKQAREAGRRDERQAEKRVSGARSMGTGRSRGSFEQSEEDDPLQRGYEEAMRRGGAFGK